MCHQYDWLFSCGHRSFAKYDNCPNFGQTCLGASGNHLDWPVQGICRECQLRASDPNPNARMNDPYRQKAQSAKRR